MRLTKNIYNIQMIKRHFQIRSKVFGFLRYTNYKGNLQLTNDYSLIRNDLT